MLSAQCDGLRERAKVLRQGDWSDGAEDAKMMDDAADTILSLRDRAQDLQTENAKLRELLAEDNEELAKMRRAIDYLYSFAKPCGVDAEDMRELGIGVDA